MAFFGVGLGFRYTMHWLFSDRFHGVYIWDANILPRKTRIGLFPALGRKDIERATTQSLHFLEIRIGVNFHNFV